MAKLKPIERFHENFRTGDLVRIVLRKEDPNKQRYEKVGYIKEINTGSARRHPINILLTSSSDNSGPVFKVSYFVNKKGGNPYIEGYEVLRRADRK